MEKPYDLEKRTEEYAVAVTLFCKSLPRGIIENEYISQLVRSAGSIGANYIEGNESLGKKDFALRIRICRKEAKESGYWLRILKSIHPEMSKEIDELVQESTELMNIFGAILKKTV